MNHFLPYKIDAESEELFYYGLGQFSSEVFEKSKSHIKPIIDNFFGYLVTNKDEFKGAALELILIGVLWDCHIGDAIATDKSELAELVYTEKLIKNSSTHDIFRKIFYRMRADVLLHHDIQAKVEIDEKSLRKLLGWLEATGEYSYEIPVVEKWLGYWQQQKIQTIATDLTRIINFTDVFVKVGDNMLGSFLNPLFFTVYQRTIPTNREDYFQVSKPEPEYMLNLLSAEWLNEINDEVFQSFEAKKLMAPGCMRPENGKNCNAIQDGAYLKCSLCNSTCNIFKLRNEIQSEDSEIRIAVHQSTFKAEAVQLKESGIVGVACAGCLLSGGLMLKQKDISAKCLILNNPGCNKHWTETGEETNISYSQVEKILAVKSINCLAR
jgi:hypothetical protein